MVRFIKKSEGVIGKNLNSAVCVLSSLKKCLFKVTEKRNNETEIHINEWQKGKVCGMFGFPYDAKFFLTF